MRHPKILPPLVFRKRANHKSRNAQPQSEREPQNEARFADCAIFGERRLFINAEAALAFLGKTSVKISGENRPKSSLISRSSLVSKSSLVSMAHPV